APGRTRPRRRVAPRAGPSRSAARQRRPPSTFEPSHRGRRELACVMASPGLQQPAVQLLGRERECAVIDRVLADAGGGAGGALAVRGEAGIGKSALLDYARQRAAPMVVLSAVGVEAESDLAFAGL